jgi:protease II
MHKPRFTRVAVFAVLAASATLLRADAVDIPKTRVDETKDTLHGVSIPDPYRWLEDQASPETRAWIDAQNAHSHALLGKLPGREALKARLEQLLNVDAVTLPVERGRPLLLHEAQQGAGSVHDQPAPSGCRIR